MARQDAATWATIIREKVPLLDQVLSELRSEKVDAWPAILQNVSLHDVAQAVTFDPSRYSRTLLACDERVELLLLGWMPGQASAIHDHGASEGAMLVLTGDMREDEFDVRPDGSARLARSRLLARGESAIERPDGVHRVTNAFSSLAVTLHAYGPRLASYETYDESP